MIETKQDKQHFLSDLARVNGASTPEWIRSMRKSAASEFEALEFPNRRQEAWRFTNVSPIVRRPFRSITKPKDGVPSADAVGPFQYGKSGWAELVFLDGFFAPELSRLGSLPKSCLAGSLAQAIQRNDPAIQDRLGRYLPAQPGIFAALNTGFMLDGAVVRIPKDTALEFPIHLLFVSTEGRNDTAAHPRNLIVLEPLSAAVVIESYVNLDGAGAYLDNAVTEICVEDGARLVRYKLTQEDPAAFHLSSTYARVGRDATFNSYTFNMCGKIARNELSVALEGAGGACSIKGLYMTEGDQLVDNATTIEHVEPHCSSWIGYKGILADKSHAVFTGRVHVHRGAQKTDSDQLNSNLLLSDKATIDTKPQLEIFADDVKCTHGATVGQHPEELIYYFRTRGIDEPKARAMLTYGFADEVVSEISVSEVRERLERVVFDRYSPVK